MRSDVVNFSVFCLHYKP